MEEVGREQLMGKILSNIRISLGIMKCNFVTKLLTFCLMMAGFVLAGMTLISVNISDYDKIQYQKKCDIKRTGVMRCENSDEELKPGMDLLSGRPHQRFWDHLKKSGLVEKCAQYTILGREDVDQKLVKMQEGHQISQYAAINCVEAIYAQRDIFDIYGIEIDCKVPVQDWENDGVLLGSQFKSEYENEKEVYFYGKKCPILGFIKKDQKLSFERIAYEGGTALTGLYNLDYSFFRIVADNVYQGYDIHYKLADHVSRQQFQKDIDKMAKKYHTTIISQFFLDQHLADLKKENIKILGKVTGFAVVLLVGVMLLCIISKIMTFFLNKSLYGILYSSGLTTNQVNTTFIFENFIIMGAALILAFYWLYYGINFFCEYYGNVPAYLIVDVVKSILVSKVFVQEFLLYVFIAVITSLIPMAVFSGLTPLSMMRGFYEGQ